MGTQVYCVVSLALPCIIHECIDYDIVSFTSILVERQIYADYAPPSR